MSIKHIQLNIGCLSRNKFWNEDTGWKYRDAVCTSTLLEYPGGFLLVDPGLTFEHMKETIFNRRGINMEMITAIFLTHFHDDHRVELEKYGNIPVFSSAIELATNSVRLPVSVIPFDTADFDGITLVKLPGHTTGTAGLGFVSDGERVLVAGDAVMTKDFFMAGEGYFNTVDCGAASDSIQRIRENFDLVIPGHDVKFCLHH